MNAYDADSSRENSPYLPPIQTGFDTPGSDYMTGFRNDKPKRTTSGKSVSYSDNPLTSGRSRATGYSSYTGGSKGSSQQRNEALSSPIKTANGPSSSKRNSDSEPRVIRDHTVPFAQDRNRRCKPMSYKSYTDIPYTSVTPRNSITQTAIYNTQRRRSSVVSKKERKLKFWDAPEVTNERYASAKESVLSGGKFKDAMVKYFGEEPKWWEEKNDSEDDGYDTDLDRQLGFELIADEKTREILQDGPFPEYKQECRRFRSNPNSYFLRHCLDDDVEMKHRYLSKPDSITVSNFIKNHLSLNTLNLEDNGIGPNGMKYFTECLRENKSLTEMYLAGNHLGPEGAKHLQSSLVSNCFLLKLDISDNNLGEKGGICVAAIIEENVTLKELNMSGNDVGDVGIKAISKALGSNISLKVLDLSWNNIQTNGALSLCSALKQNTELEVFLASMNGFGEKGGNGMVSVLRENNVLTEVDLSSNRIPDTILRTLSSSLDSITNLTKLNLANNLLTVKPATDCLMSLMANPCKIKELNLEGIFVGEEFKGLCKGLLSAHDITVLYRDPPAGRSVTSDILTKNLKILCEFMTAEEIEVEDLFPDYDDDEEPTMITMKEAMFALEYCGKITCTDKLQALKSKMQRGRRRKFQICEFMAVYDTVSSGHDPLTEQPLRTHLRRSIKDEREAAEKLLKSKKKRSLFSG